MDAKTLCLAVLTRGDASGYEIKKALEEPPLGHFQDTGFGSIYPALTKLTDEGLVRVTEQPQKKRPDKKVYALTADGRARLNQALLTAPAPDRFRSDFLFVLYFGYLLSEDQLAQAVEERIAFYDSRIERMSSCDVDDLPAGQQLVHGFGLALYQAAADYLRANRGRLDGKIDEGALLVAE